MKEFVEKLIGRLEYLQKDKYVLAPTVCYVLEGVKQYVKDLASEHNNGWIPCSERLPEDDKNRKYLVCGKSGGIYIAEFVCKSVSNNTSIGPWWSSSCRYCPNPIAWQPLPAPYKKGE